MSLGISLAVGLVDEDEPRVYEDEDEFSSVSDNVSEKLQFGAERKIDMVSSELCLVLSGDGYIPSWGSASAFSFG